MKFANILWNRYFSKDPFFLIFFVTARCQARCKFCFNWDNIEAWKTRAAQELTIDEVEKVTKHIKSFQQLTLSGGEPFLRKDLDEICTLFHKNSRVQFITIPTNGLMADRTQETLTRVLKKNPNVHIRIGLSTSAIGDDLEDIYEVKDSFKKHQETYRMLSVLVKEYKNLNFDCGIVFSKYSENKVKDIIQYALKNMPEANPIVSLIRGKPRFSESHEYDVESLERLYTYTNNELPRRRNRPFADWFNIMRDLVHKMTIKMVQETKMVVPCKSGKNMLVIQDNGDVFPCELLDNKMGNLRDHNYNIHAIMKQPEAKQIVKDIVEKKCFCTWECALNNNILYSPKYTALLGWNYFLSKIGLYNKMSRTNYVNTSIKRKMDKVDSSNKVTTRRELS